MVLRLCGMANHTENINQLHPFWIQQWLYISHHGGVPVFCIGSNSDFPWRPPVLSGKETMSLVVWHGCCTRPNLIWRETRRRPRRRFCFGIFVCVCFKRFLKFNLQKSVIHDLLCLDYSAHICTCWLCVKLAHVFWGSRWKLFNQTREALLWYNTKTFWFSISGASHELRRRSYTAVFLMTTD